MQSSEILSGGNFQITAVKSGSEGYGTSAAARLGFSHQARGTALVENSRNEENMDPIASQHEVVWLTALIRGRKIAVGRGGGKKNDKTKGKTKGWQGWSGTPTRAGAD